MLICAQPIMLTQEELKFLTCSSNKAGQCKGLKDLKIPYRENPSGWPIALRSEAEKVLSTTKIMTTMASANDGSRIDEPDFSKME